MDTTIIVHLPEDIAAHLAAARGDLSRAALEGLALEGYRAGELSTAQVRRMLGFQNGMQVHAFLERHGMSLHYGPEDLPHDRQTSDALSAPSPGRKLSPEEWSTPFEEWGDSIAAAPLIPDEALSRENFYPDR